MIHKKAHHTIAALAATLTAQCVAEDAVKHFVKMEYVGHASFLATNDWGTTLLIDPYQNSPWSYWFEKTYPALKVDGLLITHNHFDHNAVKATTARSLLDHPGKLDLIGFTSLGIQGRHARSTELRFNQNTVFHVDADGLNLCYWGDNEANISPSFVASLGVVDVLIMPVDESEHLLSLKEVESIILAIKPKIVIPMHYFNEGLTSPCSTLGGLDSFLANKTGVRYFGKEGLKLSKETLPAATEIWIPSPLEGGVPVSTGLRNCIPCWLRAYGSLLAGGTIFFPLCWIIRRLFTRRRLSASRHANESSKEIPIIETSIPPEKRDADFRIISLFIDNAKTYVQLSSGALAISIVFMKALTGSENTHPMPISACLVCSWLLFVVAIGCGVFYQYLGVKYLEAKVDTSYKRLAGLGRIIERPWPFYMIMMAAFYGGMIAFVITAITTH